MKTIEGTGFEVIDGVAVPLSPPSDHKPAAELAIIGNAPIMAAAAVADRQQIALWLHGRSPATQRAYRDDAERFLAFVAKPLRDVSLGDLQNYQDSLAALATSSQARRVSAIKSLLSFLHREGYLPINRGVNVRPPKIKGTLAERILSEDAILHMLAQERNPRNKTALRLLYLAGLRISELCNLRVRDLSPNRGSGQITIQGKGGGTRGCAVEGQRMGRPSSPM